MNTNSDKFDNDLVALASIAAVLHSVKQVAWGVSLAAKNAMVISAQAGDKGRGFQPITTFIDEISQIAMEGVNEISDAALMLSRIAVENQRQYDAYQRFLTVKSQSQDARYIATLDAAMKRVENNMLRSMAEYKKAMRDLVFRLEAMDENMLAARAIASVSRIVTADSGEYRSKLEVVANNLETASVYIKEKVLHSYQCLSMVSNR
ncbi:MAG: hypothetical protein OEZ68_18190 [Gammaproteobacteria bacterium]|nr:hypothetical protein [Gammaproteobacteria bacterium]MDH5802736.1 hypothetical protein [Gammaproteobacteria bacterium]